VKERKEDLKCQPLLFNKTKERTSTQSIMKIIEEVLPQKIGCLICFLKKLQHQQHQHQNPNHRIDLVVKIADLEGPDVMMVKSTEGILDVDETAVVVGEINVITTLEINLDQN